MMDCSERNRGVGMLSISFSNTFRILGAIAALSVAAGHYVSTDEMSPGYVYTANLIFQDAIGNGFFRLAVPTFALLSGFFYFLSYQGRDSWVPKLRQRISTVVIPYILASTLFFLAFCFAYWWFQGELPAFSAKFLIDSFFLHPHSVQLWYLRDLMVLVVIAPLFNPRAMWATVLLGAIAICWALNINFLPIVEGWYLINLDTLLFFSVGAWFALRPEMLERLTHLSSNALIVFAVAWLVLSVWRISIFPGLTVWYQHGYTVPALLMFKATIICGLILVFNLAARLNANKRLLKLSGYGFFLYLFHFYPLNEVLYRLSDRVVAEAYRFWICGPAAVLITFLAALICERYLPSFYRLINGGRGTIAPRADKLLQAEAKTE